MRMREIYAYNLYLVNISANKIKAQKNNYLN